MKTIISITHHFTDDDCAPGCTSEIERIYNLLSLPEGSTLEEQRSVRTVISNQGFTDEQFEKFCEVILRSATEMITRHKNAEPFHPLNRAVMENTIAYMKRWDEARKAILQAIAISEKQYITGLELTRSQRDSIRKEELEPA